MKEGTYHADNGDVQAVLVREEHVDVDGGKADRIAVLAVGDEGSGLSEGWNFRNAKRGHETGEWTPAS